MIKFFWLKVVGGVGLESCVMKERKKERKVKKVLIFLLYERKKRKEDALFNN